MSDSLTQNDYFKIIDSNLCIFNRYRDFAKYVPNRLYKYTAFPTQKYKKKERMQQLKNGEIWLSAKKNLNDPFEFEHILLNDATLDAKKYYDDKKEELEIFCLTDSPLSKLMWSHYADSYRGYCIEYYVEEKMQIYPVIYNDTLINMSKCYQRFYDHKNEMSIFTFEKDEVSRDIIRLNYPLLIKDECWAYEKEFRIIKSIETGEHPDKGHLRKAKDYGLYLSSVIVGTNCSPDDIALLESAIRFINNKRYQKAKEQVLKSKQFNKSWMYNIDHYVRLWMEKDTICAPIVLKRLTWDEKLQLTTKDWIKEAQPNEPHEI